MALSANYETGYDAGLNNNEKTGMTESYFEGYDQGRAERLDKLENDED